MPANLLLRRATGLAAAVVAALLAAAAPASAASTCAAQGIAVAPLQSDTFYIDSATSVNYLGSYVGYKVTNTGGGARGDLWERLESFSGDVVAPARGGATAETLPLPDLAPGASTPLYSYLKATATTAVTQKHDVVVYDGRPGAGGTEVCRETQTIARVSDVIKAAANKVESASVAPSAVALGATFTMTVTGDAGTIGAGPGTDLGVMRFSPAVAADWPSEAFRLVGVDTEVPTGAAATPNRLGLAGMSGSPKYKVVYRFRAVGPTSSPTPVSPVQNIASGTQVKHTDPGTLGALAPIPVVTNTTTIALTTGPGPYVSGERVPLTVTVHNAGTGDVSLDDLELQLPAGWTYAAGSAERDGAAIDDPYETTATELHLVGPHAVAGGGDAVFTLDAFAGASGTSGVLSAVGTLAGGQIDATLATSDDSPASAQVAVLGPPTAHDDAVTVPFGSTTPLDVLANDDLAGGAAAITITRAPVHGDAVVAGGRIEYTPDSGYSGPDDLGYRLATDAGHSDADVSVTVSSSAGPTPPDVASTGVGTAPQTRTVTVPSGGSVTLLDGGVAATTVTVPEGTYVLDPATGAITFAAVEGFAGSATPVTYEVTTAGGSGTAEYTPTVTPPAAPSPAAAGSTGTGAATQTDTLAIPHGGAVTLLDGNGDPARSSWSRARAATRSTSPPASSPSARSPVSRAPPAAWTSR